MSDYGDYNCEYDSDELICYRDGDELYDEYDNEIDPDDAMHGGYMGEQVFECDQDETDGY